ncbi:hypothetical protein B9479_005695 [Cryptococcus floricola]|uniref:Amino acid permease/ SLC12A domain-containing protein n=1 Tax=Cryptococcus floricola TaxID=2591691 RepID=A0A5D3ATV4_9TREE|nr:hypothetical protein B9479_005695 [Cryptococcus floricola]
MSTVNQQHPSPVGGSKDDLDKSTDLGATIDVQAVDFDPEAPTAQKQTKRHLKPRHVQMMGISGSIGTGLFIGIGTSLSKAGPLGLLLAYSSYALLVFSTYNAMGEMVCWLPVDGSIVVFAHKYLDDAWGFALGWLYFIVNALAVASEASAVAAIINYWTDAVNNAVYVAVVCASLVGLNIFGVHIFGEGEFYFSLFKVFLIMGLLFMTFITMVGGNPEHDAYGFRYWKDPGPFAEYLVPGNTGRFLGFWSVFVQAAYAYGGPDFIALAAGETRNPRRVLPSVFRRVIYRLMVFYLFGALAVGVLCPSDDPDLTGGGAGAAASPFVIGVKRLNIPFLPDLINALLMTSAWSCGLELFYGSSRALYSLAVDHKTPAFFRFTWRGVPTFCVLAVSAVSLLAFMSASNSSLEVFTWLTNIVGSGILLQYIIYHIIYIRFRRAQMAQGIPDIERPWYRKGQYYSSMATLFSYIVIYLTNGFAVFIKGNWSISNFIFAYASLLFFLVPWVGYKIVRRGWLTPLAEVELYAGRAKEQLDFDDDVEMEPVTKGQKLNKWLWG